MKLSHCDLHLGNMLVKEHDQKFTGVLKDFEFSSQKDKSSATKGNIYTQAPETLFAHTDIRDPF